MSEQENNHSPLSMLEYPRVRQSMYLHCGPEFAFWELMHGWNMLMDYACDGISWDHPAKIEINEKNGQCVFHVWGGYSPERVYQLLDTISFYVDKEKWSVENLSVIATGKEGNINCTPEGDNKKIPWHKNLAIMLIIAYSQNVRLFAVRDKTQIEMLIYDDDVASLSCKNVKEENQWYLEFTPNLKYISEMPLGSAFKAECLRRVCAYSQALTICVQGGEMHEFNGTQAWKHIIAPYPCWKKSVGMRLFVPGQFDLAYSFRPETERKCEVFAGGHKSGGQPEKIFETVFELFISEHYGKEAVIQTKKLGFVVVLSLLNLNDIIRPSMASEDCYINEDSTLYKEINTQIMRSFQEYEPLHKFLEEEYGLKTK